MVGVNRCISLVDFDALVSRWATSAALVETYRLRNRLYRDPDKRREWGVSDAVKKYLASLEAKRDAIFATISEAAHRLKLSPTLVAAFGEKAQRLAGQEIQRTLKAEANNGRNTRGC
jgi:hypothetical protein